MDRSSLALSLCGALLLALQPVLAAPAHPSIAGVITSSTQAQLPVSAFPGAFSDNVDEAVSAAGADSKSYTAGLHSVSYTNLGMLGGWYQEYFENLPSGGTFFLLDLVSYYGNADAATAAFNDAAGHWTGQAASAVCNLGRQCVQVSLPNSLVVNTQDYSSVFRIILVSNSLFEGGYLMRQSDIGDQQSSANAYLDALSVAYLGLFTAPTPTSSPLPTTLPKRKRSPTPLPTPQPTAAPVPVDYQLPDSSWPAGTRITKSIVPANDDRFTARFHTSSVATLGRIDGQGYEEAAVDSIATKRRVKCGHQTCVKKVHVIVRYGYAVDLYGSSSQASGAFADARNAIGAPDVSASLGITIGDQMYIGLVGSPKKKSRAGFLVFRRGKVTVDMAVFSPYKDAKFRDTGILILAKQAQWLDSQAQTQR
ncbi:MAG: hypothetical protein M3Z66_16395 [Chloroflexota bacterium]|nr:hypothetical protein [Chloroflexota bacterium]